MKTPKEETKTAKVREHLLSGKSITSWQAIMLYNCTRLSAVIFNLVNDYDMDIRTEMVYEDGSRYAKYTLHLKNND